VTHEDDAVRAVRAALALVDAVGRLGGAAAQRSLRGRAAVTTGEAAVTVGAVGQGMVAGDLVNTAARLQGRAPSGSVLVDATTREAAPDAATYEPIGAVELRGRSAPVDAVLARPRADGDPAGQRGAHTGPFVGRERELRELLDLFDAVVRDRHGRLVTVTGIAGIGKSRLAWELRERLDALDLDVAWHEGRAPAYGQEVTFTAVAEMVRRRIRITDAVDPELARRQLDSVLTELVRDERERRWMHPRVAALLGRDELAQFDRDELFAAWRRFFERVSDAGPVVLVFEDLQWADASLLDFIEHLAAWTRDHPVLVVALARPELLDRRPGWGSATPSYTAIHLERLPDAAMRRLLLGRRPDLPDEVVDRILEHAGGVPLYAVEVVRGLHAPAEGPAAERRRAPRPGTEEAPAAMEVPDSLRGVVAARIDALPAAERRLLLTAAVLGRRFRPEALAAVTASDPSSVRRVIDGLVGRELLALDDELASPSRGELAFVQDVVRDVAYGTLARSERRSLHLAAARDLETREDDAAATTLAGHLLEAHRLAPQHPDAPRIARRAVGALRRAAQAARRLHAPDRALGLLESALRLVEEPEQRAVVLDDAAEAARSAARLDLAERHLRELIAVRAATGPRAAVGRLRARLASVLLMEQRNATALAELEAALRSARGIGRDPAGAEIAAQLARARLLTGDERGGLTWGERAHRAAVRLNLRAVAADALVTIGTARFRLGETDRGLAELREAIDEAHELGALGTELRARNNLAWLIVGDDPRATLETARVGFELASQMGVGDMAVQLADVACAAAIDAGEWDWAHRTAAELAERGVPDAYRLDLAVLDGIIGALRGGNEPVAAAARIAAETAESDAQLLAGLAAGRAWEALLAGRHDDAWRLAWAASRDAFGAERAHDLALAGRAALWNGDVARAREALTSLREDGSPGRAIAAARTTLAAGIAGLAGDPDAAGEFAEAAAAWRSLDLPLPLALSLLDARRLSIPAEPPAELRALIDRLGAEGLRASLPIDAEPDPLSRRASGGRTARSRRPSADTASRSDGARPRRRASDPSPPPG
jgi:hypothetical protein